MNVIIGISFNEKETGEEIYYFVIDFCGNRDSTYIVTHRFNRSSILEVMLYDTNELGDRSNVWCVKLHRRTYQLVFCPWPRLNNQYKWTRYKNLRPHTHKVSIKFSPVFCLKQDSVFQRLMNAFCWWYTTCNNTACAFLCKRENV